VKSNRKLTELQLAILAATRDGEVEPYINYRLARFVHFVPFAWRSHGFDVTCQVRALRKRELIKFKERFREGTLYVLSPAGDEELSKHPEF
jgi:hypothetical protein